MVYPYAVAVVHFGCYLFFLRSGKSLQARQKITIVYILLQEIMFESFESRDNWSLDIFEVAAFLFLLGVSFVFVLLSTAFFFFSFFPLETAMINTFWLLGPNHTFDIYS